jgi:alpha-tubulin suppressor-like RCC1 family protein
LCAGRGGNDGSKTPKLIDKLQDVDVVKVYCGAQFSLALTGTGSVYSWGKGDTHRLGHASEEHVRFPKLIEALHGKVLAAHGASFQSFISLSSINSQWIYLLETKISD